MGYLNKEDKTTETIDAETGWMKTGDIGKLDEDGFLFITGRIKGEHPFMTYGNCYQVNRCNTRDESLRMHMLDGDRFLYFTV